MGGSAQARILELRGRAGELLTPLGVAEVPRTPQVFAQPPGTPYDWLVLRLGDDPAFMEGALAIPRAQRRALRELDRRGVVFDELLIAHEIPRSASPGQRYPSAGQVRELLAPPGDALRPGPAAPALPALKALSALADGLLAAGTAVREVAAPLFSAADPVLVGAIIASPRRDRPVAAFFEVARWDAGPPVRRGP